MAPIDARNWSPETEDPLVMLRAVTMCFMYLLSKQPNMMIEIDAQALKKFPFDLYQLSVMSDENGNQTFLITTDEPVL